MNNKAMSYIKIYPISIIAKINSEGCYVGEMVYDIEQYGHILKSEFLNVELLSHEQTNSPWWIRVTNRRHSFVGISVFMTALNCYFFKAYQFNLMSQSEKVSADIYEYHFDRVYFDMGNKKFNIIQKIMIPDSGDALGSLLKINASC